MARHEQYKYIVPPYQLKLIDELVTHCCSPSRHDLINDIHEGACKRMLEIRRDRENNDTEIPLYKKTNKLKVIK